MHILQELSEPFAYHPMLIHCMLKPVFCLLQLSFMRPCRISRDNLMADAIIKDMLILFVCMLLFS
jgi:hypothetical protein